MLRRLADWFDLSGQGATWKGEITGGATTFLTMAYIIFLQPAILAGAGMDVGAVMVATCVSTAIATLLMGLVARYPIAIAPGMGENFFFVYGVVIATGMHWTDGLSAAFYAGLVFVVLSVVRARNAVLHAIPDSLKSATGIGVGLLIAFLGFINAGIVVKGGGAPVAIGDLTQGPTLLALAGLLITVLLMVRGVYGAVFWGLMATAAIAWISGIIHVEGVVGAPPSVAPTFGKLTWVPHLSADFLAAMFVFLFMDVVDTVGTLAAVGKQGGFFKNGELPRARRAFLADSVGTVVGAIFGTSTLTSYVESSAGIAVGARTGLAAVVVAIGFLLALFISPLVQAVAGGITLASGVTLQPITAPALIIVGAMMTRMARDISWDDVTESLPAFLIVAGIPLTLSIADGLSLGFILYPIVKLVAGRRHEVHPVMYILAIGAIARYLLI
ncbi:MAG: NCS2 family permease [Candidatus Zixiibacteriota bacterium]